MEIEEEERVAYLKFDGLEAAGGVIAAEAGGTALLAYDEILRFFNRKQSQRFTAVPYDIPVRTTDGSWTIWLLPGIFAAAYLKKAAEKMAENDFRDVGFKEILKKSAAALKKLIELTKHTKGKFQWTELSWHDSNTVVSITNEEGRTLFVPAEFLKWYFDIPPNLLKRLTAPVDKDRILEVGVKISDNFERTSITVADKEFFGHDEQAEDDEILFPELLHGDVVRLEGKVTRGNENTNAIGIEYHGHILNCIPETGSVRNYKFALFLNCAVEGIISRHTKGHVFAERRPTIIFRKITPLERDKTLDLFDL